jgi:OTU domain-containing protein 5
MRIIKNRSAPNDENDKTLPSVVGDNPESSSSPFGVPNISSTAISNSTSNEAKISKKRNRDGSLVHKSDSAFVDDNSHLTEGYNSEDEYPEVSPSQALDDEVLKQINPLSLYRALRKKGFQVVETALDGNCLFRAVADQVYGDMEMHNEIRRLCMNYMEKERDHYSQFVTEDFPDYIARKRQDGVFGNHLELQAIAEMYNRPVYIYTVDERPLNIFQGIYDSTSNSPIRLSYHYGNHYNSVRDPESPAIGVGLGLPGLNAETFNKAEKALLNQILTKSEEALLEEALLRSILEQSERDEIEEALAAQFTFDEGINAEKRKPPRSPSSSPASEKVKVPSSPSSSESHEKLRRSPKK